MPETDYLRPLGLDGLDFLRFEIVTVGGQVVTFVAQYETTLDGKLFPVVRYDNHHGFCHRDRMNRRGDVVQKDLVDGTPGEVATLGLYDIKKNWKTYRSQFLGSSE